MHWIGIPPDKNVRISKWEYEKEREVELLDGRNSGCESNNGSKSNPCLCADILGDWREEIIARQATTKSCVSSSQLFPPSIACAR